MQAQDFKVEWETPVGFQYFLVHNEDYILGASIVNRKTGGSSTVQNPYLEVFDHYGNFLYSNVVSLDTNIQLDEAYFIDENNIWLICGEVNNQDYNLGLLISCTLHGRINWIRRLNYEDFSDRFHKIFPSDNPEEFTVMYQYRDEPYGIMEPAITRFNLAGEVVHHGSIEARDTIKSWGRYIEAGSRVFGGNFILFGTGYANKDSIYLDKDSVFVKNHDEFWFLQMDANGNHIDTLFTAIPDSFLISLVAKNEISQIDSQRFFINVNTGPHYNYENSYPGYNESSDVCLMEFNFNSDSIIYHYFGGSKADYMNGLQKIANNKFLLYGATWSTDFDLNTREEQSEFVRDAWFFVVDSSLSITEQFFLPDSVFVQECCEYEAFTSLSVINENELLFLVRQYTESPSFKWKLVKLNRNSTSIQDLPNDKRLLLYPIPSSKTIKVLATNAGQDKDYVIFDLQGRIHSKGTLAKEKEVDISSLASGIYFLHLKGMSPMKFEKE